MSEKERLAEVSGAGKDAVDEKELAAVSGGCDNNCHQAYIDRGMHYCENYNHP